jgi:hypothetical protein
MGEAVAIVSVSASAVVAVGGLVATAANSARERRWQSREERATELRAVLEAGGECVSKLMFAVTEGYNEARHGQLSKDREREIEAVEKQAAFESNRIGVRLGPQADEYLTFRDCWLAAGRAGTLLEEADDNGLDREQRGAYTGAWKLVLDAETAYLNATAKTLRWDGKSPPRWKRLLGRRGSS